MHRIRLLAAVAIVVSPLAIPPPADAGPLCSSVGICGRFHLTGDSVSYVTVHCGGGDTVRVYPGYRSPGWCDANYFWTNESGYRMTHREVVKDGFVKWFVYAKGVRVNITDGHEPLVRKVPS